MLNGANHKIHTIRYTPNNYSAGCVATVIAQAMSVTRHIGSFNNIPHNWDNLIKIINSGYRTLFPKEATTIGLLTREIGYAVGMNYGKNGSLANTKNAVKRSFVILLVDIKHIQMVSKYYM